MRRIFGILIIVAFAFLLICFIVPQIRAFVWDTLGPPVQGVIGNFASAVTGSSVWQLYIAPNLIPLVFVTALVVGWFTAYIWHRWIFNPIRATFVKSAVKESGATIYHEPTTTTPLPTPTPTATETEKGEEA